MPDKRYTKEAIGERIRQRLRPPTTVSPLERLKEAARRQRRRSSNIPPPGYIPTKTKERIRGRR